MKLYFICIVILLFNVIPPKANGQGLRNLKKGGQLLKKVLKDEPDNSSEKSSDENEDRSINAGSSKGESTRKFDPPDINKNIQDAIASYNSESYSAARHATQQALVGVQLEIGHELLKKLPESVNNIGYVPDEDAVVSVGSGFVGVDISRQYDNDDSRITLNIVSNNNMVVAGTKASLASVSTVSDDDYKVITVQGFKALLELDDDSFNVSIPLGETSLFGLHCNACQTESDVTNAINSFDLKEIENTLEN